MCLNMRYYKQVKSLSVGNIVIQHMHNYGFIISKMIILYKEI